MIDFWTLQGNAIQLLEQQGFRLGRRRLWAVAELTAWIAAGAPSADRWAVMKK